MRIVRHALAAHLVLLALLFHGGEALAACGTSCQCGPGERCDSDGQCKAADDVTSPAAHPLCCSDPDCAPNWLVCENLDGSIGTCGAAGCTPHGCMDVGTECGVIADGCGGTVDCGDCPGGHQCIDGQCNDGCLPDCSGKSCGDDGCDGSCGNCQPGYVCTPLGLCELCSANCAGKSCGDDGCGGSCGSCPPGMSCTEAFVCDVCQPDCTGKECGDNGCGGSCGLCPVGLFCSPDGVCISCLPQCAGKSCGDDGCGGQCGTCSFTEACDANGQCGCTPDCLNRECGDDGCGGSCGSCGLDTVCSSEGACVPESDAPDVWAAPDAPIHDGTQEVGTFDPADEETTGPGDTSPSTVECPPGTHNVWGACVKDDEETSGGSGGCSTPGTTPHLPWPLALALGLLWWRRRLGETA